MEKILSIPSIKELKVNFLKISGSRKVFDVNVFPDDTIKDIKNKIYCSTDVNPGDQYLFIETLLDKNFFDQIDIIFGRRIIISKKQVLSNLSKILSVLNH